MAVSPRLTRKQQQEQLRQRLLDAALGVFRRTGFAKATIQEIADLAGCTRGSAYLHFGSKEDLWVAVLEENLESQLALFRQKIESAEGSDELVALLAALGAPSSEARVPSFTDAAAVTDAIRDSNDALLDRVQQIRSRLDDVLCSLVGKLCAVRGVEPPLPIRDLTVQVLALRQGLYLRAAVDTDLAFETQFKVGVNLLLSGRPTAPEPAELSARSER